VLFQIGTGIGDEITGTGEAQTGVVKEVQLVVAETGGLSGQIGVKHHTLRMNLSLQTSR
jgi:hypothetical protein